MRSNDIKSGGRVRARWQFAALLASAAMLAPALAPHARAATPAADGSVGAVIVDESSTDAGAEGAMPIVIDASRREIWGSLVCGLARAIGKIDPGFGGSADLICQFIQSLDEH